MRFRLYLKNSKFQANLIPKKEPFCNLGAKSLIILARVKTGNLPKREFKSKTGNLGTQRAQKQKREFERI